MERDRQGRAALLTAAIVSQTFVWGSAPTTQAAAQKTSDFERRKAMVEGQIVARGVRDPVVLQALRTIPRHEFVPPALAAEAYSDSPLPIGEGQTISQPYIVGYMTELLRLDSAHKVLEIGTGSGYQAAVLSLLAKEVYSIEIVESLGLEARERLTRLGYGNIHVRIGDGYKGWPEQAPFDRIILTAAPPEIPRALLDQLASGGRLIAPVGPNSGAQEIIVADKDAAGKIHLQTDLPVRFVPMVKEP
jgi:protein-L-isoaspartate(D-aspartate) O-methyltransferase